MQEVSPDWHKTRRIELQGLSVRVITFTYKLYWWVLFSWKYFQLTYNFRWRPHAKTNLPPRRTRVSRQETLPKNVLDEKPKFQQLLKFLQNGFKSDFTKGKKAAEKIYVNLRQWLYRYFMEQCTRRRYPNNKLNISTDDFLQMSQSGHTNPTFEETLERRYPRIMKQLGRTYQSRSHKAIF